MSTISVVNRETKSWKWVIAQLLFMSTLAYLSAFSAYQLLT
jgi:ferrous iron transport protein B